MQSWSRSILKGILSYAQEVGPWHVWIDASGKHEFPVGWRGDGVIARVDSPEIASFLNDLNLPVVDVCDDPSSTFQAPKIRTDDRVGTELAAGHLIERGLRNIGFVGPQNIANAQVYHRHFLTALEERDLECHSLQFDNNDPDILKSITEWLLQVPKPIGILAWGHGFARNVMDCCLEEGISVPHDVAVISGSYDELFSHACYPSLSGILLPTETIGYQAAQVLHKMMLGEPVESEVTLIPPRGVMAQLSTDTLAIDDPKLIQVINFIRANAFEPITMDDILREVPMARRSLERRFRQTFGHSPSEEIRKIRVDRARKLLAETDLQMQEIAENCGYATYNYLTHVFKKTTGKTPREYRNQFRS